MGCGCGGKNRNRSSWRVVHPDGKRETFTSEPDARLAAAKSGGKVQKLSR